MDGLKERILEMRSGRCWKETWSSLYRKKTLGDNLRTSHIKMSLPWFQVLLEFQGETEVATVSQILTVKPGR
jgi:hypothetical protein